jgi:hypothetical protein
MNAPFPVVCVKRRNAPPLNFLTNMSTTSNPQNPTDEYLLLIRGTHWNHGMSPAELQRVMTEFYSWVDGLVKAGVHRGAQPLVEEGKLVTGAKGSSVTDGVFAESKEAIAGYFLLAVPSIEEAVRLAQACPILAHGAQIEVRPVADLCRPMAEVKAAESDWTDDAEDKDRL